jgi:hypothetical protein
MNISALYQYDILYKTAGGLSLAGIVGSNPPRGMDVWLLYSVCVVSATGRSLVQRSPTKCGMCLSVIK